jgi:hypothetical protein
MGCADRLLRSIRAATAGVAIQPIHLVGHGLGSEWRGNRGHFDGGR